MRYLGRIEGSPPGLPGGGITGVLPRSGAGVRISGSIPAGGHSTPSERASLSPSGSASLPVVVPSGTATADRAGACSGAQLPARDGEGGAVSAGGVTGPGGACAVAVPEPEAVIRINNVDSARLNAMPGKRSAAGEVPDHRGFQRCPMLYGTGSAKNAPSAASAAARSD